MDRSISNTSIFDSVDSFEERVENLDSTDANPIQVDFEETLWDEFVNCDQDFTQSSNLNGHNDDKLTIDERIPPDHKSLSCSICYK